MVSDINRFLRFVCVVDGRNVEQLESVLLCSRATVIRYAKLARLVGVDIAPNNRSGDGYKVIGYGPFDVHRLRAIRFEPLTREAPRRIGHSYVRPTGPRQRTVPKIGITVHRSEEE